MTWAATSPRAAELADTLAVLGAGTPRMLGYGDARNRRAAPGAPRLLDVPLDEAVSAVVHQIRAVRPHAVVTHDALGQPTGHSDHRRTHQVVMLAVQDAALGDLHPLAGEPRQVRAVYCATHPVSGITDLGPLLASVGKQLLTVPESFATTTVDISPWLPQKWAAVLSHQGGSRPRPDHPHRVLHAAQPRTCRCGSSPTAPLRPAPAEPTCERPRILLPTGELPPRYVEAVGLDAQTAQGHP